MTGDEGLTRATLLSWGLMGVALFLVGYATDDVVLRLLAKPFPVVALLTWTLLRATGPAARPVAIGLALSLVGDVLLELPGLFLPGLVAFLLAHIAYIVGFTRDAPVLRPSLAGPSGVYVTLLLGVLWPGLGELRAPVATYAAVIGTMMWRAAVRATTGRAGVLGLLGASIFALSDTLIALDRFYTPLEGVRPVIILTYWAAQAGIALSLPSSGERHPAGRDSERESH